MGFSWWRRGLSKGCFRSSSPPVEGIFFIRIHFYPNLRHRLQRAHLRAETHKVSVKILKTLQINRLGGLLNSSRALTRRVCSRTWTRITVLFCRQRLPQNGSLAPPCGLQRNCRRSALRSLQGFRFPCRGKNQSRDAPLKSG